MRGGKGERETCEVEGGDESGALQAAEAVGAAVRLHRDHLLRFRVQGSGLRVLLELGR